ncbi:MAG: class I tRNA ligase family protein, partial [Chitinophagaceae bacterium]
GHLLYSRMWTKCLYDLNLIDFDEPFKRLLNQGMIQGSSRYVYRVDFDVLLLPANHPVYISDKLYKKWMGDETSQQEIVSLIATRFPKVSNNDRGNKVEVRISPIRVDVNLVDGVDLDITAFRKSKVEYNDALFILEDGSVLESGSGNAEAVSRYVCGTEVEKMSKSKYNTVNPDVLVEKYGADTFRMYEMFLGPVEMSKPWDTKGIEGVHRFLKKLWRLFYQEDQLIVSDEKPTPAEFKTLHKTIKKIEEDTERFSFNTCISAFMVCVNELTDQRCHKREVLAPLLILITPYAPHAACELWEAIAQGSPDTPIQAIVLDAPFPEWNQQYLTETSKEYPVSVNGKLRTTLQIDLTTADTEVEAMVLNNEVVQKWLEGRAPKKIIFVKGKMINVVV